MHKIFCTGERDARHAGAVRRDNENRGSNGKPEKIKFSLRKKTWGEEKRFSKLVYELLPTGKNNAVKKETLCAKLGINARTLRKYIMLERQNGAVILSNAKTGGYYIPSTPEELDEFVQMQKSQIFSRFRSIKSAQEFKKKLAEQQSGQLTLNLLQED